MLWGSSLTFYLVTITSYKPGYVPNHLAGPAISAQFTWESNKIQIFRRSWRPILFEGRFSYHVPMQPDKTDRYRWNIGLFSNLPIAQKWKRRLRNSSFLRTRLSSQHNVTDQSPVPRARGISICPAHSPCNHD